MVDELALSLASHKASTHGPYALRYVGLVQAQVTLLKAQPLAKSALEVQLLAQAGIFG